MGKNMQLSMCMVLFKLLVDHSIVHMTQWALVCPEGDLEGR